jgi:hypothetical protein
LDKELISLRLKKIKMAEEIKLN